MRLIDADKIRYKDMSDGQVPDGVWHCFLEDIRKQPTYDAIPIEFIKDWMGKLYYGVGDIVCEKLIEDWEKANERKNNNGTN